MSGKNVPHLTPREIIFRLRMIEEEMKNDSLERWSVSGTDEGEFNILRQNIEELVFGEFPSLEEDLGRWDLDDRGGGEE